MNYRFLIKYATRGRPIWFVTAIENILATIKTFDYEILVSADLDDPTMNNDDIKRFCAAHPSVTLCFGDSKSKVEAINADMEKAKPWDILVNTSDDMSFRVLFWDAEMVKLIQGVFGESLDFFAHFNDGYLGEQLPTMSIIGKDYYNRDNYIYYPKYKSFSCDAEAMYVAQMRERWHYFSQTFFMHQHPANVSTIKNDEVYRINSLATDHDVKLYWQRLNRYFDEPYNETTPIPFQEHLGKNL